MFSFSQHDSLDGRGGLPASARWHTRGKEILYCAPNPATAVLEILDEAQLPTDWSRRVTGTRARGDRWLREGDTALLVVRTVLVPETYNVLINPRHADAARIKRLAVMPYPLDSRLLARD